MPGPILLRTARPSRDTRSNPARAAAFAVLACVLSSVPSPATSPPAAAEPAGIPAGVYGAAQSALTVVNRDCEQPATIAADFYEQRGGQPMAVSRPSVAPCGSTTLYGLDPGRFAADVETDRPIALVGRTDWTSTGDSALFMHSMPAADVTLPYVARHAAGESSIVTIQNVDVQAPVDVVVTLTPERFDRPVATLGGTIQAGRSTTLDFGALTEFDIVRHTWFAGSLRVRASSPVAVHSFVDIETQQRGVAAFEGVPIDRADTEVFAPFVASGPSGFGTRIAVANPGSDPVDVVVTYRVSGGAQCPAGPVVDARGIQRIAAGSSLVFGQQAIGPGLAGPSGLPPGCVGAAVVRGTGGVAVAVLAREESGHSAAYTAFSARDGGAQVLLPLFRNRHLRDPFTTVVSIMNVGSESALVSAEVRDANGKIVGGCGAACGWTIPPRASATWYPPQTGLPQGFYGSATLSADQPLAVVVTDWAELGTTDAGMYTGIPVTRTPMVPNSAGPAFAPLVLMDADLGDRRATPWAVDRSFFPSIEKRVSLLRP